LIFDFYFGFEFKLNRQRPKTKDQRSLPQKIFMKENRREFLKKSCAALSMTAMASQMRHFGLMSALAQKNDKNRLSSVPNDYRALVCIFMLGGNDGNNTVIPLHGDATLSGYSTYSALRAQQGLALAYNTILAIPVPRMGNLTYGLHPSFGVGNTNNGLHELFYAQNKMAIVTNVGTLVKPTTRTEYQNPLHPKPYQLYSHSDQASQYQSSRSDRQIFTGWAGRLADQRTSLDNPGALIPMITSIAGAQIFTAGQTSLPMAIAPAPTGLNDVLNPQGYDQSTDSQTQLSMFNYLRTQDLGSEAVAAASHVTDQAMIVNSNLQTYQEVTAAFPNTSIGNQLKQVARLIKKRGDLNVKRQIFFVQIGGFDTHNIQLANHVSLLSQMSQAMRSFYDEMVVQGLGDKVTQFTMSDFSRTMSPSGAGIGVGSDHAWANHHFVVGGAVAGSDFYGLNTSNGTPYPTLALDGPDDADVGTGARGRWIPTTSVEQYAATLARWFGLPEANMVNVFPNIANFTNTNLGFMRAE
jgi:uncharacterized protein (DUF1501 family)